MKLAVDKATEAEYACKIMALPQPGETPGENENTREDIFKEIDILCSLNHDNVVFLKEYFEEHAAEKWVAGRGNLGSVRHGSVQRDSA